MFVTRCELEIRPKKSSEVVLNLKLIDGLFNDTWAESVGGISVSGGEVEFRGTNKDSSLFQNGKRVFSLNDLPLPDAWRVGQIGHGHFLGVNPRLNRANGLFTWKIIDVSHV
ncbi:hypothetical protein K2Y11_17020 [bacterium]|nr:hypothetical protein [bacterium]